MKLFIILMKRLYLIRWINSLLCFLSTLTSIFLTVLAVYYERLSSLFLVPISFLWWLLIIPILYLATEFLLLRTYRQAIKLDEDDTLPYAQINQEDMIIFENNPEILKKCHLTIIGNPMSFLDPRINFLEVSVLIKSRALGITIGLLTFISVLLNIFLENIATTSNFIAIFIIMIILIQKVCNEDLKN